MQNEDIWNIDSERQALWSENPRRAAMLAYLEVVALWHDQVEQGIYWGVPALHRLAKPEQAATREVLAFEPSTLRSRPHRYSRDESASEYVVPVEIRERWLRAAA